MWHVGSQFPNQRLNPCPLHWKHEVLAHWTTREVPDMCISSDLHRLQSGGRTSVLYKTDQFLKVGWEVRQQQGKEGVGVNGESSTDVYARSCVRQMAGGQLLCDPGRPAGHSVMT